MRDGSLVTLAVLTTCHLLMRRWTLRVTSAPLLGSFFLSIYIYKYICINMRNTTQFMCFEKEEFGFIILREGGRQLSPMDLLSGCHGDFGFSWQRERRGGAGLGGRGGSRSCCSIRDSICLTHSSKRSIEYLLSVVTGL